MNWKIVLGAGLAGIAALSVFCGMAYMIHSRDNTIAELRDAVVRAGEDPDIAVLPPKVYEPVTVNHFYERRGHKILLSDNTFGQIWLPVLADVPLSSHPTEKMVETDKGRMLSFDDAGNLNALTGIDISSHNTVTDWNAVKADGIDFVMLRLGYRGYGTEGKLAKDKSFRANYNAAKEAGLLVGAYFFSQAITEEEAVEEAILSAQQLEGCQLDFPVAFDWEIIYQDNEARTNNVPCETLTDAVLAYCQNMQSFGYQTMWYQNKRTTLFKIDTPRLTDIPFWLAEYGDGPTFIYDYDMWQYSCTGKVAGIEGDVDLNLCFKDFSKEGHPLISLPAPEYTPKQETAPAETAPAETAPAEPETPAEAETPENAAAPENAETPENAAAPENPEVQENAEAPAA